jgi:hypothetical protein
VAQKLRTVKKETWRKRRGKLLKWGKEDTGSDANDKQIERITSKRRLTGSDSLIYIIG